VPFPRPTLLTLRTLAMQDMVASDLPNANGFLRRAALRVIAWIQAGMAYLHWGYLDWIALNGTPFTATAEYLDTWAAFAPTPVLRQAPEPATGQGIWSGILNSDLPAGTAMNRADGFAYITTADAVVGVGNTVTAPFVAVLPGSAGNSDLGTPLTLSVTLTGIVGAGAATTVITGGTDLEQDPPLRNRMLESYRAPPHGGDAADYVTWALEIPGVTRAWPLRNGMGSGSVVVYFMMDQAEATFGGFPQGTNGCAAAEPRAAAATGDQLALANFIYPLQPVTALVYATAPAPDPTNFTLTGLTGITTTQKAAVSAALAGVMALKGSPLADTPIQQSDFEGAVNTVAGLPPFAITVPATWPITPPLGSLFTLGTVSYL
jgi:uncharacterized phage protein gp47/JayE